MPDILFKRIPIRFSKDKQINPDDLEKEIDNLYRQLNFMLIDTPVKALEITVTDTSGNLQKITIEVNKYGIVKKADIRSTS